MPQINIDVPMDVQRKAAAGKPVVMINHFNVPPELAETYDFVRELWEPDVNFMKLQPGFISVQLHKAYGGQNLWVTYAVWESVEALEAAVTSPKFQEIISRNKVKGIPQIYTKVAVKNACLGF